MKRDIGRMAAHDQDDGEPPNPDRRADNLMPFEAVAKAIFVKANGLVAYQDATGTGNRKTDMQPKRHDDENGR